MQDVRLGSRFRALRHRLSWRQQDLADHSGVSQDFISLVERGHLDGVPLRKLRRVADQLDAELVSLLRWRGGDLDRLVDEGHARLVGASSDLLKAASWQVRAEVSYAVYGERGSIDLLAWHASARALLVVEVKTELVSVEETLRKHDEKVRLAPTMARERLGWQARIVGGLLILPDLSTPRRRVARHEAIIAGSYPTRGTGVRTWLKQPTDAFGGLLFVDPSAGGAAVSPAIGRKRIGRPRTRGR